MIPSTGHRTACFLGCMVWLGAVWQSADGFPGFRVHVIDFPQPPKPRWAQTSLVDVNRDGRPDYVVGSYRGPVSWYEYVSAETWIRHEIFQGGEVFTDVGGVAFDVDGDGWVDQVSGKTWFRNPGASGQAWEQFENGAIICHDNLSADINGDGRPDLIALADQAKPHGGFYWYEIPEGRETEPWVEHVVFGVEPPRVHGGAGVGDLDGDGDLDLTRVDRWFENLDGKGTAWGMHLAWDFGHEDGRWGLQTRVEIRDIDGDGDQDVVQAEGDYLGGRLAWFENQDGKGRHWKMRLVQGPGHDQDFHSLVVHDFDSDGDWDIHSGGGPLTLGTHFQFVWENTDGKGGSWQRHVIAREVDGHETVGGDVDGDGDIDLTTKAWNAGPHIFLENQLIR